MKTEQDHPVNISNPEFAKSKIPEDILAILCAGILLLLSLVLTFLNSGASNEGRFKATNPLSRWVGKPSKWTASPVDSLQASKVKAPKKAGFWNRLIPQEDRVERQWKPLQKIAGTFVLLSGVLALGIALSSGWEGTWRFMLAFPAVFVLAALAYMLAANSVVKAYNLEYALWALGIGLMISNTVGTPEWLKPAVKSEFMIKTGLVMLGAGVLMSRLLALGIPGVCVAWIVTPIVLISTYWFGQRVLKMKSRSLNMVISADMSVCGVSAAIASAAACRAKKEELSLAIGMSLSFTVIMMVVMPMVIKAMGLNDYVGGAWLGGTIDSTGAVAAAGALLGDKGLEVAGTVKMIQNILIGVAAFGIATYWVAKVEANEGALGRGEKPRLTEIWVRFPKFILGFVGVSIVFSLLHGSLENGPALVDATVKGSTKVFRGWLFCLAFVCIGLETRFREFAKFLRGGKPLVLYLCGQALNLILTLTMAYLMFGLIFKDSLE